MAPKRQNQHESLRRFNTTLQQLSGPSLTECLQADDEAFCAKIEEYYFMGITDTKMAPLLQDDFELSKFPRYVSYYAVVECDCPSFYLIFYFSTKTIQRRRETLGLKSSNQLKATFEMLEPCVMEIRERFPTMGQRQMRTLLLQDYSMKVNECVC